MNMLILSLKDLLLCSKSLSVKPIYKLSIIFSAQSHNRGNKENTASIHLFNSSIFKNLFYLFLRKSSFRKVCVVRFIKDNHRKALI